MEAVTDLTRGEFLGGVAAGLVAAMFGLSIDEAVAAVRAGTDEAKDDTLTFVVGGTQRDPRIRVEGVITAMELGVEHDYFDVFDPAYGAMPIRRIPDGHTLTITTRQPFRVRLDDEFLEANR